MIEGLDKMIGATEEIRDLLMENRDLLKELIVEVNASREERLINEQHFGAAERTLFDIKMTVERISENQAR